MIETQPKEKSSTKTIRISMELYEEICKRGRMNDTFPALFDRLFKENPDLLAIITEK